MKLFHCPPTRSQRALWALYESGLDFESERVDLFSGAQNAPAYLAVQSRGVVPALWTENGVVVESSAIAMFVFERAPASRLSPPVESPERGRYLQWCLYAPAELDLYLVPITQNTLFLPEELRDPQKVVEAKERLGSRLAFVAEALEDRTYLLGDHFTGADVCIGHSLQWARMVGALDGPPVLGAYLDLLAQRPAFQKTYAN